MKIKIQSKRNEIKDIEFNGEGFQIMQMHEGFIINGEMYPHELFCFYIEDNDKVVFDNLFIEAEYTVVGQGE